MTLRVGITVVLLSVCGCSSGTGPGKVIFTESTEKRYVALRDGRAGHQLIRSARVSDRPELEDLREVHGNLAFICREIHGVGRPRIVIETRNTSYYQVVFR